nr:SDR family oxidoreductase [Sphingomonas japonica]
MVTGGCRRLGAHIAARLGEAGYDVAYHGRSAAVPDRWLAQRLNAAGARHHGVAADLDDAASVAALVGSVADRFEAPVDLLVNNASRFDVGDPGLASMAAMTRHFTANVAAPVMLAEAVAAQGVEAAVVNILDQRIAHPPRDQLAYTLSKQALAEATRTLATSLAPRVRVNGVAPGLTLPTGDYAAAQLARLAETMPLRRLPDPDDVADAVLFLARARSTTGQIIFVDGGAGLTRFDRDFVNM